GRTELERRLRPQRPAQPMHLHLKALARSHRPDRRPHRFRQPVTGDHSALVRQQQAKQHSPGSGGQLLDFADVSITMDYLHSPENPDADAHQRILPRPVEQGSCHPDWMDYLGTVTAVKPGRKSWQHYYR